MKHPPITRLLGRLLPLGLAAFMIGCSTAPVPVPVIRPPVTPGLGQIPTPQPELTPTPDLTPAEALEGAQRLAHNGDYEAAIQAFHTLTLDPNIPAEVAAEASFGKGQAALQQGSFAAALAAFDSYLATYSTYPQAATATFMRGEARLGVSDWAGAIADFEAYLSLRPSLADSYVHERIGDAHLALGQLEQAITAYNQATAAGRHVSSLVALRERVAQVHLGAGNPQAAVAEYEAILSVAQIPTYRAKVEFLLAQAYFAAGNSEAGNSHLLNIVNTYPETTEAYSALESLDAAGGYDVDLFQRGLVEFSAADYAAAEQSFYGWLALAEPDNPNIPEVQFYRARSYAVLGNPDAALSVY